MDVWSSEGIYFRPSEELLLEKTITIPSYIFQFNYKISYLFYYDVLKLNWKLQNEKPILVNIAAIARFGRVFFCSGLKPPRM